MHHHRLVLNGPPGAVARLADELRAAGAVGVAPGDVPPARMVWATARPAAVEALCARHRGVVVGLERFETLGAELERLVLRGGEKTVLERRPVGGEPALCDHDRRDRCGFCLDRDGAPLDAAALRRAARGVATVPVDPDAVLAGSSLGDALLIGPAIGRLCRAAGDPLADEPPPAAALAALRELAAVALTIGAACSAPACAAELELERAWRLTRATTAAGREPLCARPGDADWPEWLMALLSGAADVIACCASCLQEPATPCVSVHAEHHGTADEQLDQAAGDLAATALQALVLLV